MPAPAPAAPQVVRWNQVPAPWTPATILRPAWHWLREAALPATLRALLDGATGAVALARPVFVSRYLSTYLSRRGTSLLFHGVSGAVDEIPTHLARVLERRRDTGRPLVRGELTDAEALALLVRGHLTPLDPPAELARFERYVARLHGLSAAAEKSTLMLLPSYACNLRCPYCFETPTRKQGAPATLRLMTEAFIDELFERVLPDAFGELEEGTEVRLYGGEPFLPAHLPVIRRVLGHAARRRLRVSATTNGTLVHEALECFGPGVGQIGSAQLSLDGPPAIHDRSRVAPGGPGTFERIVQSAILLAGRGTKVGVRINVTAEVAGHLPALAEALRAREAFGVENLSCYCAAVSPVRGSDARAFPELLTTAALQEAMGRANLEDLLGSPLKQTRDQVERLFRGAGTLETDRTCFCMLGRRESIAVDPAGDVYGCYKEAGDPDRRVGTITARGRLVMNERHALYRRRTVSSFEPCRSCSIALFCGGGCARRAEDEHGTIFAEHCDSRKELVGRAIVEVHAQKCSATA